MCKRWRSTCTLTRYDGAIRVASAATLPSYVSAIAVALATGRHHPSGEYSELAGGSASQDPANASTKPVTVGGNKQRAPRVFLGHRVPTIPASVGGSLSKKGPAGQEKSPAGRAGLRHPAVSLIYHVVAERDIRLR